MTLQADLAIQAGAVAASGLGLGYKLPALLRHPRDRSLQAFCVMVGLLGLSIAVLSGPGHALVDGLLGVPHVAYAIGNSIGVVATCMGLVFVAHLTYPEERARRLDRALACLTLFALALLAVLFIGIPREVDPYGQWNGPARSTFLFSYRVALVAVAAFTFVTVAGLTWRYSLLSSQPSMRIGLRLVSAGAVVGLAWTCLQAVDALQGTLALVPTQPEAVTFAYVLVATSGWLINIGATFPSWGPRLGADAAPRWISEYVCLQRLDRLWRALFAEVPEVYLVPPRGKLVEILDLGDVYFRLYRRLIEVHDALLLLGEIELVADWPARAPAGLRTADFSAEARRLERRARANGRWG